MQPDNDQIIKEISEAEQYLRALLGRLLALNATPRNLLDIGEALQTVSRSYIAESQYGGALVGHSMAVSGILSFIRHKLR